MNKEELLLTLIEKLLVSDTNVETRAITPIQENESVLIGKYVILRCRNAGVHFGKLEYAYNGVYRLSESRRLYRWRIKNKNGVSLSELASEGIDTEYSQVCKELKLIEIIEREGGEIIPVEDNVIDSFKNILAYNPN